MYLLADKNTTRASEDLDLLFPQGAVAQYWLCMKALQNTATTKDEYQLYPPAAADH